LKKSNFRKHLFVSASIAAAMSATALADQSPAAPNAKPMVLAAADRAFSPAMLVSVDPSRRAHERSRRAAKRPW